RNETGGCLHSGAGRGDLCRLRHAERGGEARRGAQGFAAGADCRSHHRAEDVLTQVGRASGLVDLQLRGFFLIEAVDLNEAMAIAAKWPGARFGDIEVRPIEEALREEGRY